MKKFISVILAFVMCLSALVIPTSALSILSGYYCTVSADKTSVSVGDIITITVNLDENSALSYFTLDLVYDSTMLSVVEGSAVTYGKFEDSHGNPSEYINERFGANQVRFAGEDWDYTIETGPILTVQFEAIAVGNTGLSINVIEACDEDYQPVTVEWESLGVVVTADNPVITIASSETYVNIGDIVTVTVNLSAYSNLAALTTDLIYDNTILKVVSESAVVGGIFYAPVEIINENYAGNAVRYTAANPGVVTNSGCLFTVKFEAIAPGEASLYLDIIQACYDDGSNATVEYNTVNIVAIASGNPVAMVEVDNDTIHKGEIVTATVRLDRNSNLGAIVLDLIYDEELLRVIPGMGNTYGSFGGFKGNGEPRDVINENYSSNKVHYVGIDAGVVTDSVVLFTVEFEAIKSGYAPLELAVVEAYDANNDACFVNTNYMGITIYPAIPSTDAAEHTITIQSPSRTTIRCKDSIYLYPIVDGGLPEGTYIYWETSNDNFDVFYFSDDSIMITSQNDGYTDITVYLLNFEDDSVIDSYTIEMRSKAGFFDKIGGFFRSLFGTTNTYYF